MVFNSITIRKKRRCLKRLKSDLYNQREKLGFSKYIAVLNYGTADVNWLCIRNRALYLQIAIIKVKEKKFY